MKSFEVISTNPFNELESWLPFSMSGFWFLKNMLSLRVSRFYPFAYFEVACYLSSLA